MRRNSKDYLGYGSPRCVYARPLASHVHATRRLAFSGEDGCSAQAGALE
jgi:hypothetical protein